MRNALQLNDDVKLEGMLAQVQTYLSKNPKIDEKILFTLWAGGHDIGCLLYTSAPTKGKILMVASSPSVSTVSYTHLDVYKRQV